MNVPHCNPKDLKGYKITIKGRQYFNDSFDERIDPRGRPYYWMTGLDFSWGQGHYLCYYQYFYQKYLVQSILL